MALLAASQATGSRAQTADPAYPELVELGDQIYAQDCASCHGVDLEGEPDWKRRLPDGGMPAPPHDATGHTWHHGDTVLFNLTKFGLKKIAGADYKSAHPGSIPGVASNVL